MKKIIEIIVILLVFVATSISVHADLIGLSVKANMIGIYAVDLPDEVQTVPQKYNYDNISDSQFATADIGIMAFSSLGPQLELNITDKIQASYSLQGVANWANRSEERYSEGAGSESYVYSQIDTWSLLHELELVVQIYKQDDNVFKAGIAYSTTEWEFERGWYRYSSDKEYATESAELDIYSLKLIYEPDWLLLIELSLSYGIIDFDSVEDDGELYGASLSYGFRFF